MISKECSGLETALCYNNPEFLNALHLFSGEHASIKYRSISGLVGVIFVTVDADGFLKNSYTNKELNPEKIWKLNSPEFFDVTAIT